MLAFSETEWLWEASEGVEDSWVLVMGKGLAVAMGWLGGVAEIAVVCYRFSGVLAWMLA